MVLLSIGDQVGPGTYRFHSAFSHAINFERDGRLVSVVDEETGPGPVNIVLTECRALGESFDLTSWPPLEIGDKVVSFAGHRFRFTRRHRYDSALVLRVSNLRRFRRNLQVLGELLRTDSPAKSLAFLLDDGRLKHFGSGFERAFAGQIRDAVGQVFGGRLLEGIRGLRGCGVGLTPSGDDFIAGVLIGLHVLERMGGRDLQPVAEEVFRAAQGANIFSNTYLELARRGLLFGRMKELLQGLFTGSELALRQSAARLFAMGASSGADLVTGLFMTLERSQAPAGLRAWIRRACPVS